MLFYLKRRKRHGYGSCIQQSRNERDIQIGGDGDDDIRGGGGDDELSGEAGDDSIYGDGGNDDLFGDRGDDILSGGGGDDRVFGGAGSDILNGGGGNDLLSGGEADDVMNGGGGDDRLLSGAGGDRMSGLGGRDVFVVHLGDGADTILDFRPAGQAAQHDIIEISEEIDGFDTFEDVIANASVSGTHTVIDFGGGDSLTLENVALSQLRASDFLFI